MLSIINLFFKKYIGRIRSLVLIFKTFDNWFVFTLNHMKLMENCSLFRLRNGLVIKMAREGHSSTDLLMAILIRKEYGEIPNNIIVVDIGANVGVFSLFATYLKNNICYSYEPEINNYKLLVQNMILNNLVNKIKTFNLAVSDKCCEKKLFKFESIAHSFYRESDKYDLVKSVDLETIFADNNLSKIDLLKIDCEGAEFDIVYSSDYKLLKRIDRLIIEYHHYINSPICKGDYLVSYLQKLNFQILSHKKSEDGILGIIFARNSYFNF